MATYKIKCRYVNEKGSGLVKRTVKMVYGKVAPKKNNKATKYA